MAGEKVCVWRWGGENQLCYCRLDVSYRHRKTRVYRLEIYCWIIKWWLIRTNHQWRKFSISQHLFSSSLLSLPQKSSFSHISNVLCLVDTQVVVTHFPCKFTFLNKICHAQSLWRWASSLLFSPGKRKKNNKGKDDVLTYWILKPDVSLMYLESFD